MLNIDKVGIDKILLQLESGDYLDPRYNFYEENNELKILGSGTFSYVYEMYDVLVPQNHYAAKVIGMGSRNLAENLILETTQIQYFLSEQSENVMRVIALWSMKLKLDKEGNLTDVIGVNETRYENEKGIQFQIVLMEKLDHILSRDKYGNISLLRTDLKSEEGVIKFTENIGRALFTVHNNGFLHRDIKLENIFWDENIQEYKLGDFGIAKYIGEGSAETVVFTDGYGAPEIERQLANSYDATADIYSFGITLFVLLNDLKFPSSDGYNANIVQYSKDFIVPAPIHASEAMAKIIRKMCSYHVEDRYQFIEEVLMDIGRIDGSYTDKGFTEYEDVATETYHENISATTCEENIEGSEKSNLGIKEDIPWWEKEEDELNREERKKRNQSYEEMYTESSVWRLCISAILFAFLFKSLSPYAVCTTTWQFWILPIAMIVEALLQRAKEFQIEFGIVFVGLVLLSAYFVGVDVPHVVLIMVILLGVPAITAGCAIGTAFWIVQMVTEKLGWLSFLSRWDLGWIVIIGIVAVIESYMLLRADYNKENPKRYLVWSWILDKIWYLLIIGGIIVLVLDAFEIIEIPEILKHIHLVRIGIGTFAVEVMYLRYYGLLDDEKDEGDEEINESLDE